MKNSEEVDAYIAGYPERVQTILKEIRRTIQETAPEAEETISYGMPAYKWHGPLVYFAAFAKHVSIYPAPRGYDEFKEALSAYKGGKGTVQFPLDKPIPYDLIERIVKFRMQDNLERAEAKKR